MAAGGGQQPGQDNSMGFLWLIALIFVIGGVIWYNYKKYIIAFYFTLKLWEIKFISLFTSRLDDVQSWIITTDPNKFVFQDMVNVGKAVGSFLRYPLVFIIFFLAFAVFFGNKVRVYKRTYTMRDLVELEQVNWPQITPIATLDLIKTDIDKGPWAMAMTPMQFCKRYKLLEEHTGKPQEGMTRKEWSRVEVTLKRSLANKVFALQLGALWPGLDRLPIHIKALLSIFAARFNGDGPGALALLKKISASTATKLDFSGTEELCKKYVETKPIQKIIGSHAYILTVMASMLEAARADGVQASADFLWLKPLDRRLWYMLNTVGRQTPFVEVAGPFAHWIAEKEINKSLLVPMVGEATNALELALKDIIYRPDEVT